MAKRKMDKELMKYAKEWQGTAVQSSVILYSKMEKEKNLDEKIDVLVAGLLAFGKMVEEGKKDF